MPDGGDKRVLRVGPLVGLHEELPFPNRAWRALNVVFDPAHGFGRRPGRVGVSVIEDEGGHYQLLDIARYSWLGNTRTLAVTERGGTLSFWQVEEYGVIALTPPANADLSWREGQHVWSLQRQGFLFFSLPEEQLVAFDGTKLDLVEALPGRDFSGGVIGARSYRSSTPPAGLMERWRGRLVMVKGRQGFLSADEGDSDVPPDAPVGAPNVWPADSGFALENIDGDDEAMGVAVARDRLEIYTRKSVFIVDEDEAYPVVRKLEEAPGILAAKSLQNVGAERIYLGQGSIYSCNGQTVSEISEPIRDTLRRVNWIMARNAVSAHLRSANEFWLWLPLAGSDVNQVAVIFDYRRREWRVAASALLSDPASHTWDVRCARVIDLPQGGQQLLTGTYGPAKIYLECVGESDDDQAFPAFVVLAMVAEGGRNIAWGAIRVEADEDGAFVELRSLAFGESPEGALQRDPDDVLRALSDGAVYPATYPVFVTDTRNIVLDGQINELAQEQRVLVSLPAIVDGVYEKAPGKLRWFEVTLKPRTGRTALA